MKTTKFSISSPERTTTTRRLLPTGSCGWTQKSPSCLATWMVIIRLSVLRGCTAASLMIQAWRISIKEGRCAQVSARQGDTALGCRLSRKGAARAPIVEWAARLPRPALRGRTRMRSTRRAKQHATRAQQAPTVQPAHLHRRNAALGRGPREVLVSARTARKASTRTALGSRRASRARRATIAQRARPHLCHVRAGRAWT